jgi:hypothetical protein
MILAGADSLAEFGKHRPDRSFQPGNFVLDDIPNNGDIDTEVFVNQDIPQPRDSAPVHRWSQ